ncbi:MAG: LuxR C-terminal-related transcriptional regulator [marine benthic group bacterium]|nr:LuxR C-terminal-related transcriptional regulator [Gemmatimonadota bacterium]
MDTAQLTAVPLTLVSAAAGYGKSVLVSGWLDTWDGASAWLSLDESDNDLRQCLSYIVAAVQTVFPSSMSETAELLGAANLPPASLLAGTLINELDELEEPLILVLDDVHRIEDRQVLQVMAEILTHPPREVHLVLVGRRDPFLPIAKLRALGQLNEIRAADLEFTPAETKVFLAKVLAEDVSDDLAGAWTKDTEGWVTGLRLAALALATRDQLPREPFKERGPTRHTMQYLLQEVLAQQLPEIRHHLLYSSVVNRFCPPLCEVLHADEECPAAGVMDGRVFVDWLEDTGLFVIPLDPDESWFRYHHLFQDGLREEAERQLSAGELAGVHERASEWFESQGLIDEALQHALAAEDFERATHLVERNARSVMNDDRWYVVDGWLSRLPDSVVQHQPELLLARAWTHYYRLEIEAIPPVLDKVDALMGGKAEDHDFSGEVSTFRAFCAMLTNMQAAGLEYAEHALARIPMEDVEFRAETELLYGLTGHMEGRSEEVLRSVQGWLAGPAPLAPLRESRLLLAPTFVSYMGGDLDGATAYNDRGRTVAAAGSLSNSLAWCDYLDGLFHLQRGDFAGAIQLLEAAKARKYRHYTRAATDVLAALALGYQARGQSEPAAASLEDLREFCAYLGPAFAPLVESAEARLSLMQGRPEAAVRWMRANPSVPSEVMLWWFDIPSVTRCRALIADGSAVSLVEAQAQLREYAELNDAHHNTCQLIPILALHALAYSRQGQQTEALDALDRALDLAEPGGFIFPFLEPGAPMADLLRESLESRRHKDFVKRILTAFYEREMGASAGELRPSAPGVSAPETALLTARQLEVLELLEQGLYQKEIAARLFISPETVKTHLALIYRKLGVSNRRHAIDEARTRGLITRP